MISCIILDDEPLAQDVIETYIKSIPQLKLIKKCNNALDAFEVLHKETIDLIFLDIRMPGISGLNFIRSLKNPPSTIFTTAYSEHALTGFELDAVDYLLKPITLERFKQAINKLEKVYKPIASEEKDYTYFKVAGKLIKVFHKDLWYVKSVKDYLHIWTLNGNYLTHMTMKALEDLMPKSSFVRVHRSYLVNKLFITEINKSEMKTGDAVIPIGDNYRDNIKLIK